MQCRKLNDATLLILLQFVILLRWSHALAKQHSCLMNDTNCLHIEHFPDCTILPITCNTIVLVFCLYVPITRLWVETTVAQLSKLLENSTIDSHDFFNLRLYLFISIEIKPKVLTFVTHYHFSLVAIANQRSFDIGFFRILTHNIPPTILI